MFLSHVVSSSRWTKSRSSSYYHVAFRTKLWSSSSSSKFGSNQQRRVLLLSQQQRPLPAKMRTTLWNNDRYWMSHMSTTITNNATLATAPSMDSAAHGVVDRSLQLPPLPQPDDDVTTLLELSQEWFQVLLHQQQQQQKQGIVGRKLLLSTECLDHMAQVVSAYAVKATTVTTTTTTTNIQPTPSHEPFALWLQAACHAGDTTRAFQALQQWQDFEQQHLLQPQNGFVGDDSNISSSSSSFLSGDNLMRHYASLSSSSSSSIPAPSQASSSSLSSAPSPSWMSMYQYTPSDCATLVWNWYQVLQRQKAHALALDPRWNMSMESYYHLISTLCQALLVQPKASRGYHHQHQQPYPMLTTTNTLVWDRLMHVMTEFMQHPVSSHVTSPEQMSCLIKTFHQAIQVAGIRQRQIQQQQQQPQQQQQQDATITTTTTLLEWSEQLQRRLYEKQPLEQKSSTTTPTAATEPESTPVQNVNRNSNPSPPIQATATATQVHPMLLEALRLEQQQQQQQQQAGGRFRKFFRRNQHSNNNVNDDSLVSVLGQLSAVMQRAVLSGQNFLPALQRAQFAILVVEQLESIHDQVLQLSSSSASMADAATDTTVTDAVNTTTTKQPQHPLDIPLPTAENYLHAWNSWLPLVFRFGFKGPVRMDEFVYLEDIFHRIMKRKIFHERDMASLMQIYPHVIRAYCGLSQTESAEKLLVQLSTTLKDFDPILQPECVEHRKVIKDLWHRLLHAEFRHGKYENVVRQCHLMGLANVYPTEISRTFQLQSLAELAPVKKSAQSLALHHLEVMFKAFYDHVDRGSGSYAPPPNAQHYLAVLTSMLRTPGQSNIKLMETAELAQQVLDTAEAEAARHVQRRLQHPDKPLQYNVDNLMTIPEHYETVIAIWERCREFHPPAATAIEKLRDRLAKRKAGAIWTLPKQSRGSTQQEGPIQFRIDRLSDQQQQQQQPQQQQHQQHQPQEQFNAVPNVDELFQRTRQWSQGQNISQLNALLEDWLAVVVAEEPPRVENAHHDDRRKTRNSPKKTAAPTKKRATPSSRAVECMQLLLTEWVEVLCQATKSNLWNSSYPSEHTNKPFRILLQAYRHLGDGPAAFEVLNEWQRALAGHWSLAPDLASLHLVLEAYIRQQQNAPSSSKTDAVAEEVAKIWELLQRWHVSGRVNLQVETISHVVKCLTFAKTRPLIKKPNYIVGDACATPAATTVKQDPAYLALKDRLVACFDVMENLVQLGTMRPNDIYFIVRAYSDALHCAESVGDTETVLKLGHAFHKTLIHQPKQLIDASFQLDELLGASFGNLMSSAYGVTQRGIFASPDIQPKEKAVFLQNIVEELEMMGRSAVGGLTSNHDYLRLILALDLCAAAADPRPTQEELTEIGEQAERLLLRRKDLKTANPRLSFLAFDKASQIWCYSGNAQRGEAILNDALALHKEKRIVYENWQAIADAWNRVFQLYCESGQATEATRLYHFMMREKAYLNNKSWYSLFQLLSSKDHELPFEELTAIWVRLQRELRMFQTNANRGVPPTAKLFADVMIAFARGSYPFAGEFVENLLASMQAEYAQKKEGSLIRPSEEHYAAAISAWLRSAHPLRDARTEFLISRMAKLDTEPSLPTYAHAMEMLSCARHQRAARQAESMLDKLDKMSLLNQRLTPNRDCYVAVIDAWLNSDSPVAASQAQTILERLESEYERSGQDPALQPLPITYERIIHRWAHSDSKDKGLHAGRLLSRWEALVEAEGVERRVTPYVKVIQANQLGKSIEAGEQAESVLDRVQKHFGDSDPQVVAVAAREVIIAWAYSSNPKSGVQAWSLFRRFSRTTNLAKDEASIKNSLEAVVQACAYASYESKETSDETLKSALRAFEELNDRKIDASSKAFKHLIQTFGRHVRETNERTKIVSTIFQRCCAEGKVDLAVLANVRRHASSIYDGMCTGPNKSVTIPPEWCRNVPKTDAIHTIGQPQDNKKVNEMQQ